MRDDRATPTSPPEHPVGSPAAASGTADRRCRDGRGGHQPGPSRPSATLRARTRFGWRPWPASPAVERTTMNLDLPSLLGGVPAWTPAAGVALLTGVLVGAALTALTARRRPALAAGVAHRPETALTVAAAGIATAVSATGLWRGAAATPPLPAVRG